MRGERSGDRPTPFGELLRQYRGRAGLTQEELAELAGLSLRGLSDVERGIHRAPQRATVQHLADALELGGVERAALQAARRSPTNSPEAIAQTPVSDNLRGSLATSAERDRDPLGSVRAVVVKESSGAERVVPLEQDARIVIGRDPASTIRLDSPYVSRPHACIEVRNGAVAFIDLGAEMARGSMANVLSERLRSRPTM